MPARRLLVTSPRAQEKSDVPAAPPAAGADSKQVAPPARGGSLGMLSPSFSRMTQVRSGGWGAPCLHRRHLALGEAWRRRRSAPAGAFWKPPRLLASASPPHCPCALWLRR